MSDTGDRQVQQTVQRAAPSTRVKPPQEFDRDPRQGAQRAAKGLLLGLVLLCLGVAFFFHLRSALFSSIESPEALDAVQIAYNFRMHRNLLTSVIYPRALAGPHPDTHGQDIGRAPLYPVMLGTFFKTRGVTTDAVITFNALCMFALAWVLFGIIALTFDRRAAIWAVLAYFCSSTILSMVLVADGSVLTALLYSSAILVLLHLSKRNPPADAEAGDSQPAPAADAGPARLPWPWLIGLGVLAGLTYLSGNSSPLLWLVLAGCASVALARSRRPAYAAVLGSAVVVGAIWWVRNLMVLGTPISPLQASQLVMGTDTYPQNSILWTLSGGPDHPLLFLLSHPAEWAKKIAIGLVTVYRNAPNIVDPYVLPFVIAGMIWLPRTPERNIVWRVLIWTIIIQAITSSLTGAAAADLAVIRPLALGLGIAGIVYWLSNLKLVRWQRLLAAAGMVVIIALPYFILTIAVDKTPPSAATTAMTEVPGLLKLPVTTIFVTDNPWNVAWPGHFRAILLPASPEDLQTIVRQTTREPQLFYLSEQAGKRPDEQRSRWMQYLNDPAVTPLRSPLPSFESLLMTDTGMKTLGPDTRERFIRMRDNLIKRMQSEQAAAGQGSG